MRTFAARRLSLGGGVVVWGRRDERRARPAFYALAQGGWRDYVTLLHLPYTLWHLSYVAIGRRWRPELEANAALGARGIPARPRRRRARARRAARPPAGDGDPEARAHLARGRVSRCRGRDRDRRRARVDALAAAVRRRRSVPRPRVHAGARRGNASTPISGSGSPGELSPCSWPTWGRRRRCGRRHSRGCVRAAHEPGAALALDPGADGAAPGRARERHVRYRDGQEDASTRTPHAGTRGCPASPLGRRWSRSRWRSSGSNSPERGTSAQTAVESDVSALTISFWPDHHEVTTVMSPSAIVFRSKPRPPGEVVCSENSTEPRSSAYARPTAVQLTASRVDQSRIRHHCEGPRNRSQGCTGPALPGRRSFVRSRH